MGAIELDKNTIADLVKSDKNCLWHHIKPHRLFDKSEQMILVEGNGLVVKDIHGKEYLDASSGGVWSVILGYGRERIAKAVYDQLMTLPYAAGGVGNIPAIRFARKLIDLLPIMDKVYFSNSGSEANEKAFKMIRQASHIADSRKGKYKILFRDRDYHGTTIAALSATGQRERRQDYGPFCDGFVEFPAALCYRCPFDKSYPDCEIDCARVIEKIILKEGPETVGGIIVEPITAGGGVIIPVKEYYSILQDICNTYGVYIIMDEVVCGFGRTGKFWGHEHYDIAPDIVTVAKGLASSYEPLSATMVKQSLYDIFLNDLDDPDDRMNYFRDISTYGGCAAPCAAALETAKIIEEENLVEQSRIMGEYLLDKLKSLLTYPMVGDVRGLGAMVAIELVKDRATKEPAPKEAALVREKCYQNGVILIGAGIHHNVIRVLVPLVVTDQELEEGLSIIDEAFRSTPIS